MDHTILLHLFALPYYHDLAIIVCQVIFCIIVQQIHSLIMSLNFTRIEIKTANFLNSWGDGVLVMVSGLVQAREYNARRNFVQTFFLAPQEKGYFILNDMFHFLDEEQIHQPAIAAHEKFENNLTTSAKVPEGGMI